MIRYLFAAGAFVLFSSVSSPPEPELTEYVPVMIHRNELNVSVALLPARAMTNTGKIYRFNNYLFVVEPYKGIHVFDNTNPSSPNGLNYIRIPGCIDLTIKDGFMYVDNAVDLVTIDISDASNLRVVNRLQNVFPESLPPDQKDMPIVYEKSHRPEGLIIVEWKKP